MYLYCYACNLLSCMIVVVYVYMLMGRDGFLHNKLFYSILFYSTLCECPRYFASVIYKKQTAKAKSGSHYP